MIPFEDSLLKYDKPVLVTTSALPKSPKVRRFTFSLQPPPETASPPQIPKPEQILHSILPPREWEEGAKLWVQKVSSTPCSKTDLLDLAEQLEKRLEQKQGKLTGICPIRRELYSQCFDEVIRQVTINCAERGLLLLKVRDEIKMTIATYQTIYESSLAFGMRKALQLEYEKPIMEKKIEQLENEKQDIMNQLNEEKATCDNMEKMEAERIQVDQKRRSEEIQALQKANQQVKMQLEEIIKSKKASV